MNFTEHKELLEGILAGLENDTDWDESNRLEALYKAQGLRRYKLEGLKSFVVKTDKEETKDTESVYSTTLNSKAVGSGGSSGSTGDAEITLNVSEDFLAFQQLATVLSSGQAALEKLQPQTQELEAKLNYEAQKDPKSFSVRLTHYQNTVAAFDKHLKGLRTFNLLLKDLSLIHI